MIIYIYVYTLYLLKIVKIIKAQEYARDLPHFPTGGWLGICGLRHEEAILG